MPNQIGRFEILGEISRSPSACVLKALDAENGQTVALKTVDLNILGEHSADILRNALQEADNTKILNSHNLVLLYGAGEINGQFCSSMEYVQGNSIANMLTRGDEFSIWDLQDIVRQACQGFDHAHSHKLVHYSLEPAKLMVGWDGTVKILGFGISTLSMHTAHLGNPAATMLPYMSPEQVRGEAMDSRSNLFSLGAILYEMVTGQRAFGGSNSDQITEQILHGELAPPNQVNPKIHALVSEVILKALAKEPQERFQTGQELVNALERRKDEASPLQAKATTAGRPAAPAQKQAMTQPAEVSAAPEMISALDSSAQAAPRAKAAAAGANGSSTEAGIRGTASVPVAVEIAAAKPKMSAAGAAPAPAVDPAMAEPVKGKAIRSFSEIEELPPLKESHEPARAAVPADPLQELRETQFPTPHRGEQAKTPPAELAKKAVAEIRKTPAKLFLYSIGGAAAIILLVVALIASRVHKENAEVDGGNAAPAPAADQASEQRPTGAAQAATATQAAQAQNQAAGKQATLITIKPKYGKKSAKPTAPLSVQIPGQLTVNSVPAGAQILIDGHGEPSWLTPYDVTGLAPGGHVVSLSKSGFGSETRNVEVVSHSKFSLFVQLTQLTATVLVTAEPAGAQILVDGRDSGRVTPSQISLEKTGVHTIVLKKQGYLDETTTVNLQPGQSFRYSATLRQLGSTDEIKTAGKLKKLFGGAPDGMGAVTVKTQPKGAQIAVNRHILDKGSPTEFYLNPGTYVIDITLGGYKPLHRVVNIEKGGKLAIEEILDRD